MCHHCGYSVATPTACPECAAPDSLVACGPGVERLEEEVASLFPDARVLILSSDLITGVERMREELKQVTDGACRYHYRDPACR